MPETFEGTTEFLYAELIEADFALFRARFENEQSDFPVIGEFRERESDVETDAEASLVHSTEMGKVAVEPTIYVDTIDLTKS